MQLCKEPCKRADECSQPSEPCLGLVPDPRSKQCPVLLPGNPEAARVMQRGQLHFPAHRSILEHVHSSPFGSSGLSFPLLPASGKRPALCFLPSCVQCQQCFDAFKPWDLGYFYAPEDLSPWKAPFSSLPSACRTEETPLLHSGPAACLRVGWFLSQSPDLWGETLQRK